MSRLQYEHGSGTNAKNDTLSSETRMTLYSANRDSLAGLVGDRQETGLPPFLTAWLIKNSHGSMGGPRNDAEGAKTRVAAEIWEILCQRAGEDERKNCLLDALQATVVAQVLAAKSVLATPLSEREGTEWLFRSVSVLGMNAKDASIDLWKHQGGPGVEALVTRLERWLKTVKDPKEIRSLLAPDKRALLPLVTRHSPITEGRWSTEALLSVFQASKERPCEAAAAIHHNPHFKESGYRQVMLEAMRSIEYDIREAERSDMEIEEAKRRNQAGAIWAISLGKNSTHEAIGGWWLEALARGATPKGWTLASEHHKVLERVHSILVRWRKARRGRSLPRAVLSSVCCLAQVPETAHHPAGEILIKEAGEYTDPCFQILANQKGRQWVKLLNKSLDMAQKSDEDMASLVMVLRKTSAANTRGVEVTDLLVLAAHQDARIRDCGRRLLAENRPITANRQGTHEPDQAPGSPRRS